MKVVNLTISFASGDITDDITERWQCFGFHNFYQTLDFEHISTFFFSFLILYWIHEHNCEQNCSNLWCFSCFSVILSTLKQQKISKRNVSKRQILILSSVVQNWCSYLLVSFVLRVQKSSVRTRDSSSVGSALIRRFIPSPSVSLNIWPQKAEQSGTKTAVSITELSLLFKVFYVVSNHF